MAGILPLASGAEWKCRDRVLGEGEKDSFIALSGKGGATTGLCLKAPLPPVPPPPPPLLRVVFFFKEKAAYGVSRCGWGSGVCSSGLGPESPPPPPPPRPRFGRDWEVLL